MNELQGRPYMCGAPGCSQSFQLEEHLSVHRLKHEMSLKFPSIKSDASFTADTPTPTKFLQNCDEVGLFKEIEEEFLQAQEEEKQQMQPQNGGSCMNHPKPQLGSHLSPPAHLYTPRHSHQPPQSRPLQHPPAQGPLMGPSCSLAPYQPGSVITQNHSLCGPVPSPLSSLMHMRSKHRQPLPASLPGTLPDPAMQGAAAHHINRLKHPPGPPFHQPPLMSMSRGGPPMAHIMDMMSPRQQPLHHPQLSPPPMGYQQQQRFHVPPPQHIGHAHHLHYNTPPHRLSQGSPPTPTQVSPVLSQCQHSIPQSHAGPSGGSGASVARRRRSLEQDPDERRQKFLERNRAAATRCRQKRKVWVSSLEKKAEELTHTNLQLQNEVTSLRSEVGQLKQILLTHKDCPVSARQREGQGFSSD
ncbi:unnamed protein product [Knipowitschia caucasica]